MTTKLEELIGPEPQKGARAMAARAFGAVSGRARALFAALRPAARAPAADAPARPKKPAGRFFFGAKNDDAARARLAPPDPAKILFPAVGGGERADTSLGFELTRSANDIVARQVSLSEKAAALSRAIDERLDGETTLITQGLRVLIALFWAFLAVSLIWVSRGGEALWASWLNAVPAGDARLLARAFGVIAMAGLAAPFVIAGVVWLLGKGDNNRLRARSADLGREAGELARDFDAELDRLRQAMDGRKENPAAAVIDLSRAHLTALEAAVFFRRLHFLTDADRHEAATKFRGFLRSAGGVAPAGKWEAFMLGLLSGAFAFAVITRTRIEVPIDLPPDFLDRYPWVVSAILLGAFVYAIVGLFASLFRGAATYAAEKQARDEALDAVRSGFVSAAAPSVDSLIRRIEDALDVFQARLSGQRGKSATAQDAADETPAWRRPTEGPRFVDTPFAAAPKTFLAGDARAQGKRKRRLFPSPIPGAD